MYGVINGVFLPSTGALNSSNAVLLGIFSHVIDERMLFRRMRGCYQACLNHFLPQFTLIQWLITKRRLAAAILA